MPAPYKSLVLCFDGTWNSLKSNTNVSRLYSEIADASSGCTSQQKFYDEGVGTHWNDRIRGGAFGEGLDRNIRLGYAWLATTCQFEGDPHLPASVGAARLAMPPPDPADPPRKGNGDLVGTPPHSSGREFLTGSDIYLLGFSRGAFTARSLGGLIAYLGIPAIDPSDAATKDGALADHPSITQAWKLYEARPIAKDRRAVKDGNADASTLARVQAHDAEVDAYRALATTRYPVRLHFVGVWDTVGALGIPNASWWPKSSRYEFHDTCLSEAIRHAFHAMAIDEHRLEYTATLWKQAAKTTETVRQRWFPGAHADVGGGYEDDLLQAAPLLWLAARASDCGLEFVDDRKVSGDGKSSMSTRATPAAFELIGTEYMSPVHDSYAEFLGGAYKIIQALPWMHGPVYRRMLVDADGVNQEIDESAFRKWKADPEYRPLNLGQAGRQDVSFAVAVDETTEVLVEQKTTTTVTITNTTTQGATS